MHTALLAGAQHGPARAHLDDLPPSAGAPLVRACAWSSSRSTWSSSRRTPMANLMLRDGSLRRIRTLPDPGTAAGRQRPAPAARLWSGGKKTVTGTGRRAGEAGRQWNTQICPRQRLRICQKTVYQYLRHAKFPNPLRRQSCYSATAAQSQVDGITAIGVSKAGDLGDSGL